jgi:hypothetical protein
MKLKNIPSSIAKKIWLEEAAEKVLWKMILWVYNSK